MKFLNKILRNDFIISLRNTLKIKPVKNLKYFDQDVSVSDSFLFRTDNNFKTIFKFSDLPNLFYNIENSSCEILFFNNKNELLIKKKIQKLNNSNEILIDKNQLNGIETYGHFYFFHNFEKKEKRKVALSNRCYLGFAKKNEFYSFVHGNSFNVLKSPQNEKIIKNLSKKSFLNNHCYMLQENFENFDEVELFISNPRTEKINIYINKRKYTLEAENDLKVNLQRPSNVEIKSNCLNVRPTVFTYKNEFFDVHHG